MVIWINGAFGVGKTHTALALFKRLERAFLCDPRKTGFFIKHSMPKEIIERDFQDEPLWRAFTYELIKNIHAKYAGHIIIPATLYNRLYFEEIIEKLRGDNGIRVDHYVLWANRETILRRLSARPALAQTWPLKMMDDCLTGLEDLADRSIRLDTEALDPLAAAMAIGTRSNLEVLPR
jgi:hypothetical protein